MDIEIIRRICLSRHLFELGRQSLNSSNELYLFSAVNLIQDAIEAFLLAVADFVGANIDSKTHFDKYFVLIDKEIEPKSLPFKNKLLRLNKIRVNSKHYGIMPARDECNRLIVSVREFFDEVSYSILKVNFSTVSTIDYIKDGEVKGFLYEAKKNLESKDFIECSISCRKAIYSEILKDYSIEKFKNEDNNNSFLRAFSKAPNYTKNKDYIEKNVSDPTDYVVLDHSHLDQELLKYSIDNTTFWNIWRLTPDVVKLENEEWVVKYEFNRLEEEMLKDKIEYIFNSTVDIVFSIYTKKENIKSNKYQTYFIELISEEVPVFKKADKNSDVVGYTPKGLKKIDCDYKIIGLKDKDFYWKISYWGKDYTFLIGFISNEYLK